MIICCDFDCDTTLSVNNIEIKSDCGIFYLKGDIQQFIDSMLVNNFKLTEKVYSAFFKFIRIYDYSRINNSTSNSVFWKLFNFLY